MPLDRYALACLDATWPRLAALVALLRTLCGGNNPFTRALRSQVLKLLRPAESLARRLLLLKAMQQPAPAAPNLAGTAPPPPSPAAPRRPQPPRFRLTEPLPDGSWLSETPFPEPEPRQHLVLDAARLAEPVIAAPTMTRLDALEDVLARPAHHARRMAAWLRSHNEPDGRRIYPLAPGTPRGAVKRPPDSTVDEALRNAHYYARQAFWANTS